MGVPTTPDPHTSAKVSRYKWLAWAMPADSRREKIFDFVREFAVKYFRIVLGERFYTTEQGLRFFGEVLGRFLDHFSF